MNTLTDVEELQGNRHGLKRLKSVETVPGSFKKPKMKLKAAVAMRSLLNLLHITCKRKEYPVDETFAAVIQNSITSSTPSKLSSLRTLNPADDWLFDDKECKDNLSKTWSYFVNDPYEISESEDSTQNKIMHDILKASDGHFEDEYCQNDFDDLNGNLTFAQRPPASRIKLGISVLEDMNTAKVYDPEMSGVELEQHRSESLSTTSTDHRFGLSAFKSECDNAVSNEGSRKTIRCMSDSSLFPNTAFSGIKTGIYSELPDEGNIFLPVKVIHSLKVAKGKPQCVNEPKTFRPVSSSNISLPSPRIVTAFKDTRDGSNPKGQSYPNVTQNSQFTGTDPQPAESTNSMNLSKYPTNEILLQNPKITTNTNFEDFKDESSPTGQQFLASQSFNLDGSPDDAVDPDSVSQFCPIYSNRQISFSEVENNDRSSFTGWNTAALSICQTTTTVNRYSQQRGCLEADDSSCKFPLVTRIPSQLALQKSQLCITAVSTAIATTAAVNTAGQVSAAVGAVRHPGCPEELTISSPKSARRCLHVNLKHQFTDASLESNTMSEQAKTLGCGIMHKPPIISVISSRDLKTIIDVEGKESSDLACNVPRACDTYEPANNPLMNAVLTYRTSRSTDKRPPNASFRTTDLCSVHQSELPKVDVNGNYVVLPEDRLAHSARTRQQLTPGNNIPTPLSTSSPMHPKRKTHAASHDALQSLQNFVSPVRHNRKSEKYRDIAEASNLRSTRRQRHRNNRHNRLTLYGNLDISSDQDQDIASPCSIDYILLTRAADFIVNRIPFKKEIKPFINMKGLLEYLQYFFLCEMSKLSSRYIRTISEYRTLKTESCQTFRPGQLTHENCLSELLVSVLVSELVVVQTCSDYIFEQLRFLAGSPEFYDMPPELFLMLLGNDRSTVLGYHGFPLPYEESVRQVQRAGRKYMQAHKTGSSEQDSKLEKMFSFIIDQTAAIKSSHVDHENREMKFKHSRHEIKYRQSGQFVTDKNTSEEYPCVPNLSSTVTGSLRTDPDGQSFDNVVSFEKYCSNAYILRRIYFSYVIQDDIPYISQIKQQYAVQGRKVTYSIGNPTSKPAFVPSGKSANPSQHWVDPYAVSTSEVSSSSHKVAALPKSDPLVTVAAAGKSPAAAGEHCKLFSEPVGDLKTKMSAVQLARGEHVTGIMVQGGSVLHNLMVITNKGRHIRAHGFVEFLGNTEWTLVPPPEESKYCLQAILATSKNTSDQSCLQYVSVVWSVLSHPMNDLNN